MTDRVISYENLNEVPQPKPSEHWQVLGVKNFPINVSSKESKALVDSEILNNEICRSQV